MPEPENKIMENNPPKRGRGRPKGSPNRVQADIRQAMLKLSPKAQTRLAELLDSGDEKIALAAVNSILDRAHGRPIQAIAAPEAPIQVNLDVVRQSILERLERLAAAQERAKAAENAGRVIEHVV